MPPAPPKTQGNLRVRLLLTLAVFFGLFPNNANTTEPSIGVVYPQTEEPLKRIFQSILTGIDDAAIQYNVTHFKLVGDENEPRLNDWLNRTRPKTIISLGRRAYNVLDRCKCHDNLIVGGLFLRPGEIPSPGVSLFVNPLTVSTRTREIMPKIRRILVAGTAAESKWFETANQLNSQPILKFTELPKDNAIEYVRSLWKILDEMDPDTDALWLTQRVDKSILYNLVKKAWERRIALISSTLVHVKRGVLIAFYPDNIAMGRRLAEIAQRQALEQLVNLEPLSNVKIALNTKVAAHLRLQINPLIQRKLDLIIK